MAELRFTSEINVDEVQQVGSDAVIVAAARQSTRGRMAIPEPGGGGAGLIRSLIEKHHTAPFEHGYLTCAVYAPAFVWWEWVRHRFQAVDCPDLSFSLESGRYRELEPVFWMPRRERPMFVPEGFKAMSPRFVEAGTGPYGIVDRAMRRACQTAWDEYRCMIGNNIAPEVARAVLGFGVYYAGWVSGNPNAILNFLAKRVPSPDNAVATYPQAEIAEAAAKVEAIFAGHWPVTHAAWVANGRVAP